MIFLAICLLAIVIGLLRGGRFAALGKVTIRGGGLILALFVVQLFVRRGLPGSSAIDADLVVGTWCAVSALVVLLCVRNWRVSGMPLIALGIGLNLAVVLLNAAMPVGGPVAAALKMEPSHAAIAARGGFYEQVNTETVATALGDVIPIPAPPFARSLVSLGDLLMFVGAGILIEEGMSRGRYRGKHRATRQQL